MMHFLRDGLTLALCCFLIATGASAIPAQAQAPQVAGRWQCEYATRNIYRTDAHAVHYQAFINVVPDGTFQAQGILRNMGGFQAQGRWQVQQEQGRWAFAAYGQMASQAWGITGFAFDSFVVSASQMQMSIQDAASGHEIASRCTRAG